MQAHLKPASSLKRLSWCENTIYLPSTLFILHASGLVFCSSWKFRLEIFPIVLLNEAADTEAKNDADKWFLIEKSGTSYLLLIAAQIF